MMPNAAKTAQEQQKEKLETATVEAIAQVESGPKIEKHSEEPDLGDLDSVNLASIEEIMTMDFKQLRDYARTVGIEGSRSKDGYIQAIKEAGKVRKV